MQLNDKPINASNPETCISCQGTGATFITLCPDCEGDGFVLKEGEQ